MEDLRKMYRVKLFSRIRKNNKSQEFLECLKKATDKDSYHINIEAKAEINN